MYKTPFFIIVTSLFIILAIIPIGIIFLCPEHLNDTSTVIRSSIVWLTGYGVFFTVYTTINQLSISKREKDLEKDFKRKEEAFKLILSWDSPSLLIARNYSREIKEKRSQISDDSLIDEIKADSEKATSIALLFNYAEHIKIAVLNDIADKAILGNVCYILKDILDRFQPYRRHLYSMLPIDQVAICNQDDELTITVLNQCINAYKNKLKTKE